MRILGIDPGIARLGWGVIERSPNPKVIAFGCFETEASAETPERLKLIFAFLKKVIKEHKPDCLAIEELFFNTNAKTAFKVGEARGICLLAASENELPIAVYTPLQVKIAVTGYGRAEKTQVGTMVKNLLRLKEVPSPDDTADALAIALTHSYSRTVMKERESARAKKFAS